MPPSEDTDSAVYRRVVAELATGVTVVTSSDGTGRRSGMTANAVTSVSLSPSPQLLVCVSGHLPMHTVLASTGRFAVNVLGEEQADLALHFARHADDKFAGVESHDVDGLPVLSEAMAWFTCDVTARHPGGDHTIFIGRVTACGRLAARRPLLFFRSGFGVFGIHRQLLELVDCSF